MSLHDYVPDPSNATPHVASMGALLGTLSGLLPWFVSLVPAVYYAILIYESKTVQKWVRRRRIRLAAFRRHHR